MTSRQPSTDLKTMETILQGPPTGDAGHSHSPPAGQEQEEAGSLDLTSCTPPPRPHAPGAHAVTVPEDLDLVWLQWRSPPPLPLGTVSSESEVKTAAFWMEAVKQSPNNRPWKYLSLENCFSLRRLAAMYPSPESAGTCDRFIQENLDQLMATESFMGLPRLQLKVDVFMYALDFASAGILDKILPKVLGYLGEKERECAARGVKLHLEEECPCLVVLPNLCLVESEAVAGLEEGLHGKQLSPDRLSPLPTAKPSPAVRKLVLGEEEEVEDGAKKWKLVAQSCPSDAARVCVLEKGGSLYVLSLVVSATTKKCFLTSPTTGIPAISLSPFLSHMSKARSGFAALAIENGTALLAIGGYNRNGCLKSVERFDLVGNLWEEASEMHSYRGRFAVVQCKGVVYAIGGSNGKKELSSLECWKPGTDAWTKTNSPMPTSPRSCLAAAVLDDLIYAAGGTYYSCPLRVVEVFDPITLKWRQVAPMNTARSSLALAACGGKLYAIGGATHGWHCLAMVECYDPRDNTWRAVASMKVPRRSAAVATLNGKVYVAGGYDGDRALRTVEVYDPEENKWSYSAPMSVARSGLTAAMCEEQESMFVMGGYNGSVFLNSMECFNPAFNKWTSFV